MQNKKTTLLLNLARLLIGIVTFVNVQAAFDFMLKPQGYAWSFELTGEPGFAIIQGMGLLFLMWNVPYMVALIHPVRHLVSVVEAVIMQAVGLVGETILLLVLKGEHPLIHASVLRFILFDGGGLILLAIALILAIRAKRFAR